MIGKIFLYLLMVMIAADLLTYTLFVRKLTRRLFLRICWFLPTLLFIGLYLYRSNGRIGNALTVIFLAVALPKITFALIAWLDFPLAWLLRRRIPIFTTIALAVAAVFAFAMLYGGTLGTTHIAVKETEFASPAVPAAFDGYKIVQISDIHLQCWAGNTAIIKQLAATIRMQQPDAVMITGDLVHHSATELNGFETALASITAPDGVYSVLGNHDYGTYRRWANSDAQTQNLRDLKQRQARMGWKMLNNSHIFLTRGRDSIAVIGVENSGAPPFPDYGDLPKAMKGTTQSFKILLSHDPTHWRREALQAGIDLMLSGHTHAAQFSLLGLSPAAFAYSEWGGMYREGNRALYINAGFGHVFVPFRFGAWPEITVIRLKRK